MEATLLRVSNLITEFDTDEGRVRAVDDVSFTIDAGETLGIVGESGCGKSVTALSIMRLLPQPMGHIMGGEVVLNGEDLTRANAARMEQIRGGNIGMVFQEPMTALNPVHTIGRQLTEVLYLHKKTTKQAALREAMEMLDRVGIPSPDLRMWEYPHQLSGGMRQRVVIAMALACRPSLLIADEPT
ncbi:MAG: ABC transporter ATP-binding protein, partial [Pseudomonadales bacterium]|nr:ABC transporter ATP-binding protein [Pseudomonadales bacterium]